MYYYFILSFSYSDWLTDMDSSHSIFVCNYVKIFA
ncbi:MAG: hypothetical protein ACFWT1_00780 [Selenomonas sp.]|jgi:hypothetical protein